jgi:hypothetical protein
MHLEFRIFHIHLSSGGKENLLYGMSHTAGNTPKVITGLAEL